MEQPNPNTVHLHFRYQYDDFYSFPHRSRKTWIRDVIVLVLFAAVLMTLSLQHDHALDAPGFRENLGTIVAISIPFGICIALAFTFRMSRIQTQSRRRQREWAKIYGEHVWSVTISPAGILWEAAGQRIEQQWQLYSQHVEGPEGFAVYGATRSGFFIPKRAISEDQLPTLRELLRRYASKSEGFPVQNVPQ